MNDELIIKEELKEWLIKCIDKIRLDEVMELKDIRLNEIKRTKNFHGYKHEYNMWKFFLSLGPNYISNPLKDARYNVDGLKLDIKPDKNHQNDTVAYYDNHIFIVESKSTQSKKGNTYRALLSECKDSLSQIGAKNKRIKELHKNYFTPVHLICSKGYKIEESEREQCLKEHKIFIIDENVQKYINTVIDVSGSKEFALIQLLGLFRYEKPDFGKRKIQAFHSLTGTNKKHRVFTFSISPEEMIPISTVSHQAAGVIFDSKEKIKSFYQRLITKKRISEVSEFLNKKHQPFPNNVLVNYRNKKKLKFEPGKTSNEEKDKAILGNLPGTLSFDACPATFHVIDGQHRLFGYTGIEKKKGGVRESHRVLVTAFEHLSVEEEADIFLDVNVNAKPVKPGLVMEIEYSTERVYKRNLATSVVFKLRDSHDSALKDLINRGEGTKRPLNPKDLQSSVLSMTNVLSDDYKKGFFWDVNGQDNWENLESCAERIYQHINSLLLVIKKENRDIWFKSQKSKSQKIKNGILQNIIIGGLFYVVDRITLEIFNSKVRPNQNEITNLCFKNYYKHLARSIKNQDKTFRNNKMLQVTNWFGAGKRGQTNVADSYIFNYFEKYPGLMNQINREFVEQHYDPDKTVEEMKNASREERKLGKKHKKFASVLPYTRGHKNTRGMRYSNAIKILINYVLIRNDHIGGNLWGGIVMQDDALKKDLKRKEKLKEADQFAGGSNAKGDLWNKLECPELYNILSNPRYIQQSKPSGQFSERDEKIKNTLSYIWNNLTIFPDKPYPHEIKQPKMSSSLWSEGFDYFNIFYLFRGLSAEKINLDEPHIDIENSLSFHEDKFSTFDDYEKKFIQMCKFVAEDIIKIEKDREEELKELLRQIEPN